MTNAEILILNSAIRIAHSCCGSAAAALAALAAEMRHTGVQIAGGCPCSGSVVVACRAKTISALAELGQAARRVDHLIAELGWGTWGGAANDVAVAACRLGELVRLAVVGPDAVEAGEQQVRELGRAYSMMLASEIPEAASCPA